MEPSILAAKEMHDAFTQLNTPPEYLLQVLLSLDKENDVQFAIGQELIRLISE